MNNIILIPFYNNHIKVLKPIADKLIKDGKYDPITIHLEYGDLIKSFYYPYNIPLLRSTRKTLRKLMAHYLPSVLIITGLGFTERLLLSFKIPSIYISSAIPSLNTTIKDAGFVRDYLCSLLYGLPLGRKVIKPTYTIAWNDSYKKSLMLKGFSEKQIMVYGSPLHDGFYNRPPENNNQRIILVTTQPMAQYKYCTMETHRKYIESVVNVCAKLPNSQIIVKVHPKENVRDYDYLRGRCLVLNGDSDIDKLISSASVVVNHSSTCGIATTLSGKPLITYHYDGYPDVPVELTGAGIDVYDESQLLSVLVDTLDNKMGILYQLRRDEYIKRKFPMFDGKATERIVDLIYRMVE